MFCNRKMMNYELYMLKKNKQPDHLTIMMDKLNKRQKTINGQLSKQDKNHFKYHALQKKVQNIVNQKRIDKNVVSTPINYHCQKWISPLQQQPRDNINLINADYWSKNKKQNCYQRQKLQKMVKIMDINAKLKYFGEYLQYQCQNNHKKTMRAANLCTKQDKFDYLQCKFKKLEKQIKPKLCIMEYNKHQQVLGRFNYLEGDQFYQNIMRKNDGQLMKLLIKGLKINKSFTFTSYLNFYELFVWQTATQKQKIQFCCSILMDDCMGIPLSSISLIIDLICNKIQIPDMNEQLANFDQIVKRLLFGDNYLTLIDKKTVNLDRSMLQYALRSNEECISVLTNIFYSSS